MIARPFSIAVAVLLAAIPALGQEPETQKRATWAAGKNEAGPTAIPLARRAADAAQSRGLDAFGMGEPKITDVMKNSAQKAAELARARAATPMQLNQAKATIEAAKPNLDDAKARYEAELLEQFGFTKEADSDERHLENVRPPASHSIVLFGSASIPLDTLRAYAAQLSETGGALVFRGAPGGLEKIAPFAKLARAILLEDEQCEGLDCPVRSVPILIDPILFDANAVTQVPAVGLISKDLFAQHCDDPEGIRATSKHITYGDAAISGHLDEHARLAKAAQQPHAATERGISQ